MVAHEASKDASAGHTTAQIEKQNKRNHWPSRQTQTGINHGAPTPRGGQVQNRRRQQPSGYKHSWAAFGAATT